MFKQSQKENDRPMTAYQLEDHLSSPPEILKQSLSSEFKSPPHMSLKEDEKFSNNNDEINVPTPYFK
jgi:hypothetical protein